jgi:hypothetical protein
MMKRMLEDYVEAVHPDDYDAQDKLFENICSGSVEVPSLKEMQAIIAGHKYSPQDAGWSKAEQDIEQADGPYENGTIYDD